MSHSPAPRLDVFKNYEYEFDLDGNSAAAAVIRFVKPGSKVLEIGAGSGAITKHIVETRKCEAVAVEINPVSVKKLEQICESVHALDLNDTLWPKALFKSGKFDYVIAADVLEHVYDPWTVLRGMKSMLNDTGSIILSLPHAGHSSVVANFYDGDVEYQEWGLLDKTHVRFFGLHNIEGLYESAGLAIVRCHFVMKPPKQTEFADRWKALPLEIRKALGNRKIANVYQIVTEAMPIERAGDKITLESCLDQIPTQSVTKKFLSIFRK